MKYCILSKDDNKVDTVTEKHNTVNAVTAGGVGGALLLIIVIEFIAILLLWTYRRLVVIMCLFVFLGVSGCFVNIADKK